MAPEHEQRWTSLPSKVIGAVFGLTLIVGSALAGMVWPDLDQLVDLLEHRSIVTHNALTALFLVVMFRTRDSLTVRVVPMFFGLGVGTHLALDLFPSWWSGTVLIDVPSVGRTAPLMSAIWIAANSIAAFFLGASSVRSAREAGIYAGGLLAILAALHQTGQATIYPLGFVVVVATAAAAVSALRWPTTVTVQ